MPRCKGISPDIHTIVTDERCVTSITIFYGEYNSMDNFSSRFGRCERYSGGVKICDGILAADTDFVYNMSHSSITSAYLNHKINISLFVDHEKNCVQQVFRIICHYFLPSCGNITKTHPPSSICQQECVGVLASCLTTWNLAKLRFNSDLFITCDDTSKLLYPLPHCCTGAGIGYEVEG